MKTFRNIYRSAAIMLVGGALALTACTDGNDWSGDSSYARLFSITSSSLKVTAYADSAIVSFDGMQGVQKYIMELSLDTLFEDAIGANSRVIELTNTTDTIRGLNGETKYFLRVKGQSDGANDSKWIYYVASNGNHSFKTKAEQLFTKVADADILENAITMRWNATKPFTKLVVSRSGVVEQEIDVTTATKDASGNYFYTITGLEAGKSYTIDIYDGDVRRGSRKVATATAPDTDSYVVNVSEGTKINKGMIATAAASATAEGKNSITIQLEAGKEFDFGINDDESTANVTLPDNFSIIFLGAGGDRATLNFAKQLDIAGTHNKIVFQHLVLNDNNSKAFINQSAAATVQTLTVKDCEVKDFATYFFRLQGSNGIEINKLELNNCIFHDMVKGYAFIHVDAGSGAGVVKNISMKDLTLYAVAVGGKHLIYSNKTDMETITIENITVNDSFGTNQFFIDFGNAANGAESITIENSIFGKSAMDAPAEKDFRGKNAPVVTNCIYTKDSKRTIGDAYNGNADDLFSDPDNGDFTIQDAGISNMGDSRWME